MHLALVHSVRESSVRELAPSVTNGYGAGPVVPAMLERGKPLQRVALGFESELGARLETALVEAERHVEVLELLDEDLRPAITARVRELPNGVRAPAVTASGLEDGSRGNGARLRPVHEPEAFVSSAALRWSTFVDPVPQPTAAELAAHAADLERRRPAPPPKPLIASTPQLAAALERRFARKRARDERAKGFVEPHVAADRREVPMANTYSYKGQQLTIGELHAAHAVGGLEKSALSMRLRKGWDIEKALSTPSGAPRGSGSAPASKPPPAKKSKRAPKPTMADETRSAVQAAASMLDPVSLLERLAVPHELVGRTPRGRLVLLVEDAEVA